MEMGSEMCQDNVLIPSLRRYISEVVGEKKGTVFSTRPVLRLMFIQTADWKTGACVQKKCFPRCASLPEPSVVFVHGHVVGLPAGW